MDSRQNADAFCNTRQMVMCGVGNGASESEATQGTGISRTTSNSFSGTPATLQAITKAKD